MKQRLLWAAAGVGGGLALYSAVQKARETRLAGKVALITGGTRGLGLQIARELSAEGCHIAICARNDDELRRVLAELQQGNTRVLATAVDVTNQQEVQAWVHQATDHFGRVDILINNAGTIQVGPAENMKLEDFEQAMDLMFYGVLYPTLAVLPQMRNREDGAIVNVTSVGGKVAVPHLLPYCCAKFAATALSEGLYAELKGAGIHVLTVAPGVLRTGSYVNAFYRGQLEKEMEWFAASEMSPLTAMEPKQAARQIVRALKRREPEVILTAGAQFLARFHGAFPGLTSEAMGVVNRLLPKPGSGEKTEGIDLQRSSDSPAIAALARKNQKNAERYYEPA